MSEQVKDAAAHGLTTTDKLRMLLDITRESAVHWTFRKC